MKSSFCHRPFNLSSWTRPLLVVLGAMMLASCEPPAVKRAKVLQIEKRDDGLTYVQGTNQLFSGNFIQLNKNSIRLEEWNYRSGLLDGPNIRYSELTGELKRRIDYEKGVRVRKRAWYNNGQMRADETWKGDQIIGTCTYWFEDGRIRKQMSFTKDFQVDGQILEFEEDGSVALDVIVDQGQYVSGTFNPAMKERVGRRYFSEEPNGKEDTEKPAKKTAKL